MRKNFIESLAFIQKFHLTLGKLQFTKAFLLCRLKLKRTYNFKNIKFF
jgi:hypothetical protein